MKIPVFHDDQHGTAIIVGAAVLNGLKVVGKNIEDVKLVCSGAGAAALACLDLLVQLGVRMENIWVSDIKGVVYEGAHEEMDDNKARYAKATTARTLADVMPGADIFLGLSAGGVLKPELVKTMAANPLILALANPDAGDPAGRGEGRAARRDHRDRPLGLSEPGQQRPVLPVHLPRRARRRRDDDHRRDEARGRARDRRAGDGRAVRDRGAAYGQEDIRFGPEYLIPKPFDPRLIVQIAPAVAQAAMDSGVATRPIRDFEAYREQLLTSSTSRA
jgi:malate dehydrogenase (oxaloacetate-decarboxylating)(NADP+)